MAVDPISDGGDPQVRVAAAFTHELFEAHARMVYGLCRALLRDPDDADDATQATFIAAYRSLLGGSRVREPGAWLATIARNECTARARARMREPLPLLETDLGTTDGPEAELERQAVVTELQEAIAALPEKQREAVVLRDLYGLHYTEVGAALGISVASVESLLFRARRSLRVSLKPLASGALAVPVAVREGIAQALPALSGIGTGGGTTSGVIGLGLLAKLAGGPAAMKAAAGIAAAVAAGSIAVAGVEHRAPASHSDGHEPQRAPVAAAPSPKDDAVAAVSVSGSTGDESSSQSSRGSTSSGDDRDNDDRSGPAGGSTAASGRQGSDGSSGSGSSPSSGKGSSGSGGSGSGSTSSSGSGSGGTPEQPTSGDVALAPGGTPSSGPGSGADDPTPDDLSGTGGSGGPGEQESVGTDNSGPGNADATTTSSGDSGQGGGGADGTDGHSGDGESHSGHSGESTTPPA